MEHRAAVLKELKPASRHRFGVSRYFHRRNASPVQKTLAVEKQDEHRRVRRGIVQLLDSMHAAFFELIWRPAPCYTHPLAFRRATRLLADHRQRPFEGSDTIPPQFEVVEACLANRVEMRVVE